MLLTKSRYLLGLWCPKLLWYETNEKKALPPIDNALEATFAEGHEVGRYAQKLYPEGILVDVPFHVAANYTKALLGERKPLFEAAFQADNLYCKSDLLIPAGEDKWHLIEVKKSTKAKPEHVDDLAFQTYLLKKCGVKITKTTLLHINRNYVRKGEIDETQLFKGEDLSATVEEKQTEVAENITRIRAIMTGPRPEHERIHSCNHPYGCPAASIDVDKLPEHNLTEMYYAKRKGITYIKEGKTTFADINEEELNEKQLIQREAVLSGEAHVDKENIQAWLDSLTYPLYHFDFETISGAIPPLEGMHPYDQSPFQFSLHIEAEDGNVEHHEFLGNGGDPRKELIEAMQALQGKGSIIAYNARFEQTCIEGLMRAYPKETWLADLLPRFKDLLDVFRNFWYYNAKQKGSCSIKAVLPTLTEMSYEDMVIGEGGTAQREYVRITTTDVTELDKQKVQEALLTYCEQDTLAMVEIIKKLKALVR